MLSILATLAGGLGLLLFGMALMTDGLKLASGNALRDILALWTRSRLRGLLSGFLITAVVQSSSAVTLATIGFANAGLLSLERAIWVIYGSNVGTTMTAWIVALVGFRIDIEAFALPLVGLGALLRLSGGHARRASVGTSLVGFGLLFLGIGLLKGAFDSLGDSVVLPLAPELNLAWISLYVLIGMTLTTLMQSSSAAMVVALGAVESGLLPLDAAAAVAIGANLGTTTTALLAIWGATSTAKRVAVAHVAFNLLTALVAMLILQALLALIARLELTLGLQPTDAMTLALFHTLFNLLGVLLMWPLSARLTAFLKARFTTREESQSVPRHLDHSVLSLPYIAADAMALEVGRIDSLAVRAVRLALEPGISAPPEESRVVRKLAGAVRDYAVELNRAQLTPALSQISADLMESVQQYLLALNIAEDIDGFDEPPGGFRPGIGSALAEFTHAVNVHLECQDLAVPAFSASESASYEEVEATYRRFKVEILRQAQAGILGMEEVDHLLQYANQVKRACRQIYKATRRLVEAREALRRDKEGKVLTAAQAADAAEARQEEARADARQEESVKESTPEGEREEA